MIRVVEKRSQVCLYQEEPGSTTDVVERSIGAHVVINRTISIEPKKLTAKDLGLDDYRFPTDEDGYGQVSVGAITSSYILQEQKEDGKWHYVTFLTPYNSEEDYGSDHCDTFDLEDVLPVEQETASLICNTCHWYAYQDYNKDDTLKQQELLAEFRWEHGWKHPDCQGNFS